MIGDWLAQSGVLALAIAVVFGPGLLIGAGLRLRGLALAALAPGISVGLLAVLAIVLPLVGVAWGLPSVTVAVAVLAVASWFVGRLLPRRRSSATSPRSRLLLVASLFVGGGLVVARILTYIGVPWAISQTNDAVFHLNALRWIAETGSASSLELTGVIGGTTFYPAAWHAVASLVALTPAGVPVAVNMVTVVIAAGIWPLGIALLTRTVTGHNLATAFAAALSGALLAFPQLMFEWGVLYPYALSLALVPAAVAATLTVPTAWQDVVQPDSPTRAVVAPFIAGTAAVVGIALAQPASLLVWALLVVLWLSGILIGRMRSSGPLAVSARRRRTALAAFVAIWAVLALAWVQLAVLAGPVHWDAYLSPLGALRDVFLNSQGALPPAIGVSILLVVGIVVALRSPRWRWLAVSWAAFALLYVVAVGTDLPIVKRALTGPWYGDSYRLAAIAPITVLPLAAIGLTAIAVWFARSIGSESARRRVGGGAVAAVALIGAVGVIVAPVIQLRVAHTPDEQSRYALNDDSFLTADAHALLQRLPENLPDDALIIGNPSTGVGFAYALGRRDVVTRTWSPPISSAWDLLADGLNDAGTDPAVCEALALYGSPGYVLDFGPGDTSPGRYIMRGMTDFEGRNGFELVDSEGDASLWRITACR